ncbi:unnamed protein product [Mytilus coruscus]|uniref:Uncharacterized protein n=1 Tax=Mytilus coruscus TaxID=42192 RepID=A0A6J8A9Z6_MYTCO|nr:unnamed protein product [Mytilus coruscus]
MESRLYQIRSVMSHADSTIANKYHDQSGADIDKYALDHSTHSMNNHDFANNLYNFIAKKYYWRYWLVIAYKDVFGDDKHYQHECSGHLKFRDLGRNIVVASVDKRKSHMDLNKLLIMVSLTTQHAMDDQTYIRSFTPDLMLMRHMIRLQVQLKVAVVLMLLRVWYKTKYRRHTWQQVADLFYEMPSLIMFTYFDKILI